MNTTNLFVEVLVIGTGAAVYIILILMAFLGCQPFVDLLAHIKDMNLGEMSLLVSSIPAFSVIYVLGIITDRVADTIFYRLWGKRLKAKHFGSTNSCSEGLEKDLLFTSRHTIYTEAEYLAAKLEYGRSRLRVCRGWTLNFVLIGMSMLLFLGMQFPDKVLKLGAVSTVVFMVLAALTKWTWYQLVETEYVQVKKQAAFLSEQFKQSVTKEQLLFKD